MKRRNEGTRDETHLAVLEGPRVQRHGAIAKEGLHLCDEEVALLEKGAHLELVRLELAALDAAGEVDRREHEDGVLRGVRLDLPPFGPDL